MANINKHFIRFALRILIVTGFIIPGKSYAQGRCLIVSDIHFNPFYTNDNLYNLDRKLIKNLGNTPVSKWKDTLDKYTSNLPYDKTMRGQDSNYKLLLSAIDSMHSKLSKPDFIVIAGDFIWHDDPCDGQLKEKSMLFIARLFHDKFGDSVPIIAGIGNNDTDAGDYLKQSDRFLDTFICAWNMRGNNFNTDSLKTSGYYTYQFKSNPGLEIIVLNSILVGYSNWVSTEYPAEAKRMLAGVATELAKAKEAGKKVWLMTHIPPGQNGYGKGAPMWRADYSQTYANTVAKYCSDNSLSTVQFMISSHTHFNDFRVLYDKAGKPVSYIRLVPSIGMDHKNNPSFEVADFDASYHVINETNFYLNLDSISSGWHNTISLPAILGIKEMSATTLSDFLKKVKPNSKELDSFSRLFNIESDINKARNSDCYRNFAGYVGADSSLKASE